MRYVALIIGFMMLLSFSATVQPIDKNSLQDSQKRRLALVMGNSRYDGLENLPNVKSDTKLISSKLEKLGFQTKVVLNSSRKEMLQSIREFGQELDDNDVGLFYYAGHAVQQGNQNYMIPSEDAGDIDKSTLEFDAIDLNRVVAQMRDAESSVNIVILDACRDNPFKNQSRTRGLGNTEGLAAPSANVRGMYIAYSTAPGSLASDGDFENSPYTSALAKYIDQPGLGINEIFTRVRSDVIEQTNNAQVPWEMSSLTSDFYFATEQTEEEKSNELEIEEEMARLKEMLKQERKAKVEAEAERQKALARLEQNKKTIALERSLIEQQKLDELAQLREQEIANELAEQESLKAYEKEQKRKRKEIALAKKEQLKQITAEKKRIAAAERTLKKEMRKEKAEQKKLEALALKKQKLRKKAELAELRKIENLQLEEQEKLARLEAAKERQAKQHAKDLEDARKKELMAIHTDVKRKLKSTKAEVKEAELAERKLKKLMARQQAEFEKAERLEANRIEEERARALKIAQQLAAKEEKRLAKLKAAELAQKKREQKEAQKLIELAKQEEERIAREKRLIVSMVNNCDSLLSNSSSGRKVLSCYRDVLENDEGNVRAVSGLQKLEKIYEARLSESIALGKLARVNREYAVLQSLDKQASEVMFGTSVRALQDKARKASEESSRIVMPTF